MTGINEIQRADQTMYEKVVIPLNTMVSMSTDFQRVRVNIRDMFGAESKEKLEYYANRALSLSDSVKTHAKEFEKTLLTDEGKAKFKEFNEAEVAYRKDLEKMIELARAGKIADAQAILRGQGAQSSRAVQNSIEQLAELKSKYADKSADENSALAKKTANLVITLIVIGVLFSMLLGFIIARAIGNLVNKLMEIANQIALGDVSANIEAKTTDEIGQLERAFGAMIESIKEKVTAAEHIAVGDLAFEIKMRSDKDVLAKSMIAMQTTIRQLVDEAAKLTKAAVDGKLDTRGNAEQFKGGFKEIVQGVNSTLDSVIGPLNVAAEYVDRIGKGDIPPKISDKYNGDFNEIKNNLNQCIDAVHLLVSDAKMLAQAAVEGKLDTRADASRHQGDFRAIVQGVNATLDSVIGPLNVAAKYVDRISKGDIPPKITDKYNGDFNEIKNNLNQCIDAVHLLVSDAKILAQAAIDGKLQTRADASRHQGDFRKIVEGVNATLTTVIDPITASADVLSYMAKGDLTHRIHAEYRGDHQIMKNSINSVADSLVKTLHQVNTSVTSTASASAEIAASIEQMSEGTDQEARQVADVATAVEEMSSTIVETSKNTAMAMDVAKQAGSKAREGGKVVEQTIEGMNRIANVVLRSAETMQELGKNSEQIGEIIKVIDDIADQTNLLALNAAIEAARAGEQGRGFAVVADEVRKLAERTSKATKEIEKKIKQIQRDTLDAVGSINEGANEVESGKYLADSAGKSLGEIIQGAQLVEEIVTQISQSSQQQSVAARQIAENMEAIRNVTREESLGIQQIAHAAEDLSKLTMGVQKLLNHFDLGIAGQLPASSETGHLALKGRNDHDENSWHVLDGDSDR